MTADDFKIAQRLFELIEAGVPQGYDAFQFDIHLQDGYIKKRSCLSQLALGMLT